jgi:hypothetical protein
MAAMAATAILRTRARPPRLALALLPAASSPRRGLLLSALLHTSILAMVVDLPILFPAWTVTATDATDADIRHEADFRSLFLPVLPPIAKASLGAGIKPESAKAARHIEVTLPAAGKPPSPRPKPEYAGLQEIISSPPHSTKGVQTILRPDLVEPPNLAYPLRLPSLLMLPASAIPAPVAPRQLQPVWPNPKKLSTVRPSEPTVPVPPLIVEIPRLLVVPAEPVVPPKAVPASEASSEKFAATARPHVNAPRAAIVINAVDFPSEPVPVIPDAELASRFVVGPSRDVTALQIISEAAGGNIAGAGASNAGENLPRPSVENGTGTRVEAGDGHAGVASTESPGNTGARSGFGNGTVAPAGNKGLPGISISGGVPGRGGRVAVASPIARGSYALTIVSGGSSGGASRDLGVFSRNDTVYTVYIAMTDAGGGPDWPMQYTLMSPAVAHNGLLNGLLTPPVALKKIQATAPRTELTANSGPVFVTGIIDENGRLQALRAIRALDGRAQFALNALAQWEFLAAQLDGKPVASKVLIGVGVMPCEEVGK